VRAIEPLRVGDLTAAPGSCVRDALPIARLPTQGWLELPVAILNGAFPGPRVWLSAAVHGDELNGAEIIREIVESTDPTRMAGAVIAVPVVNVFGFAGRSRYTPDRRDLNRSFPGSSRGSLAGRIAELFMREVVMQCDLGIDLHTAAEGRTNLPQVRCDFDDKRLRALGRAFGAPVLLHALPARGTLRRAAQAKGVHVLLYEAGEALRFGRRAIRIGVDGVRRVMQTLGMYEWDVPAPTEAPVELADSRWVRAPRSGLFRSEIRIGDRVRSGQRLGTIGDTLGEASEPVVAPAAGMVVGGTVVPIVHQGDALVHLASRHRRGRT
jgi:hypothetical protein